MKMSPTGGIHGLRAQTIGEVLGSYVTAHGLGVVAAAETGFNLTRPGERRETVLAPDVAFVRAENAGLVEVDEFPQVVPDLVAEVASPDQSRRIMATKARRWLDRGVSLVWVVWPRRREVDVWRAGDQQPGRLPPPTPSMAPTWYPASPSRWRAYVHRSRGACGDS